MELISLIGGSVDSTYNYWNDKDVEKIKAFSSSSPQELVKIPKYKSIYDDIVFCLDNLGVDFSEKNFLSLAAGSCWLEALIASQYKPKSITAVDFSEHRIHELAPLSFRDACPNYKNVKLVHGDILKLDTITSTFDVIILSQAFHHTNQPIALLKSINDNLGSCGSVIITGEHYYSRLSKLKQTFRHFLVIFKKISQLSFSVSILFNIVPSLL